MIVGELFHQQSQPWEGKAKTLIKTVGEAVEAFLEQTLAYLTDENTTSNLLHYIVGPLLSERSKQLDEKLDEILLPFARGHPITYNHYFTETIQDIRQKRLEKDVTERLRKLSPGLFQSNKGGKEGDIASSIEYGVKISDLISALSTRNVADMDKYAASEILLCMEAYYKVSDSRVDAPPVDLLSPPFLFSVSQGLNLIYYIALLHRRSIYQPEEENFLT